MFSSTVISPIASIALLLNRLSLGLYIGLAGVAKINKGVGTFYTESFKGLQPDWLPEILAKPYGYAIPYLEVVVGLALIVGLLTRLAALGTSLMILSFTIALAVGAGVFLHDPPKVAGPFHTNVILITLALLIAMIGPGAFSVDHLLLGRKRRSPVD
jgi:uncharacterized membrane protein YphA (DoxX/SURF4 family)